MQHSNKQSFFKKRSMWEEQCVFAVNSKDYFILQN